MSGSVPGDVLAAGYLLVFQLCGLAAAALLLPFLRQGPRLLLGSVFGSVMLHWLPVLYAFGLGFGVAAHVLAGLTALALGGVCLALGKKQGRTGFSLSALPRDKLLLLPLALWLLFCFLVWHGFRWQDGRIFSSQATYGDMSMHLAFLTSIAEQGSFPPQYSLLPGHLLAYPFLGDSISSSLYLLGAHLQWAYLLPMWVAGAQVFFGFRFLAGELLGDRRQAALAVLLFFCNGGLGFVYFLGGGRGNFTRIFTAFYETPTNLVEENIRWVNVIVDMMLPQRATLFGWAVLFSVLGLLARGMDRTETACFPVAGVLAGALPMIHTHSFLALGLVCGAWLSVWLLQRLDGGRSAALACKFLLLLGLPVMFLLQKLLREGGYLESIRLLWFVAVCAGLFFCLLAVLAALLIRRGEGPALGKTWGLLLLITLALALPQLLLWTFPHAGENSLLRGHFGWAIGEEDYLLFYLKNLGLAGLLALGGLLWAKEEELGRWAPALLLWFVAEFAAFQPNDYDNNKLLYVAWALLCCCAARFAFSLLEKLPSLSLRRMAAGAGLLLCTASALLTMGRECVASYELYGQGATALAAYVQENLPADARVLTNTRHNNEIASLAGRNLLCGSPSYVFYHGLDYYAEQESARLLYEDPAGNRELLARYEIGYILCSDHERATYAVDEAALDRLFTVVYDDGVRKLYRVTD